MQKSNKQDLLLPFSSSLFFQTLPLPITFVRLLYDTVSPSVLSYVDPCPVKFRLYSVYFCLYNTNKHFEQEKKTRLPYNKCVIVIGLTHNDSMVVHATWRRANFAQYVVQFLTYIA